jgi:hypothetical protein
MRVPNPKAPTVVRLRKLALGVSLVIGLGVSGTAQAQCDSRGGTVAGAVIGGLLGGAAGNSIRDDDDNGFRGRREERRHYRHGGDRPGDDDDGAVIAGVLIGALAGGAIGSQVGDCDKGPIVVGPDHGRGYGSAYPADPYGRGQVTRSGDYGWGDSRPLPSYPTRVSRDGYGYGDDDYDEGRNRDYRGDERYGRDDGYGYGDDDRYRAEPECRRVQSETRLPDGRVLREPVRICYDSKRDVWYRGADDELRGY